MLPQILRNSVFRPVIKQRNLSFLQSTRLAQELKENADLCLHSLERSEFLFYHKGRPLLGAQSSTSSPTWLPHPVSALLNPDLANQSVLLGVSDGGTPQFATLLPSQADFTSIEADTGSEFTDLRRGLFLVADPGHAKTLTRGWSLLMWNRRTIFCPGCATRLGNGVTNEEKTAL